MKGDSSVYKRTWDLSSLVHQMNSTSITENHLSNEELKSRAWKHYRHCCSLLQNMWSDAQLRSHQEWQWRGNLRLEVFVQVLVKENVRLDEEDWCCTSDHQDRIMWSLKEWNNKECYTEIIMVPFSRLIWEDVVWRHPTEPKDLVHP